MSAPPELAGVRHDYIDAGGLRTHVALAGPDDGPPVLLVHGWPQHWWCWRRVLGPLAENHGVIAVDLRGHGWTERTAGGYEKDQLAGDLLALLDAMGLERVTWIGHDWGAYSGFLAALRSPDRIERMLALSIPHPWSPRDPRLLAVLLAYQGPLSLPVIGPRVSGPLLRRLLQAGRGADRLGDEDVELFAARTPPATTTAMYRSFLTRDLPAAARGRFAGKRLGVPTRLLAGAGDLVTVGLKPGPVPRQPNLEVEVVPGVGHWIPEQRPDLIVDWAQAGTGRP
jgi:pimeloyl-ACP methyl ester carboxylesterase